MRAAEARVARQAAAVPEVEAARLFTEAEAAKDVLAVLRTGLGLARLALAIEAMARRGELDGQAPVARCQ